MRRLRVAPVVIAFSIVAIPLIFTERTLDPVLSVRFLALGIFASLLSLVLLFKRSTAERHYRHGVLSRPIIIAAALYLSVTLGTIHFAVNTSEAIQSALQTGLGLVLLAAMSILMARDQKLRALAFFSAGLTVLMVSFIGLCQFYGLGFLWIPGNVVPYATMANKNLLSAFLCIGMPFAAYSYLRGSSRWRYLQLGAVIVALHLIVVSGTRSAWLALVCSLAVMLAMHLVRNHRLRRMRMARPPNRRIHLLLLLASLAIISCVPAMLLNSSGSDVLQRTFSQSWRSDASIQERLVLWEKSLLLAVDHPLGVGPGNWKIQFPAYGTEGTRATRGELFFQRPHNDFIWVLCESGILGLLFYLSMYVLAAVAAMRVIVKSDSREQVHLAALLLFGLISYLTISCFSYPRERVSLLMFSMLTMAGIVSLQVQMSRSSRSHARFIELGAAAAMMLVSLAAVVVGGSRLISEVHTKNAVAAYARGDWAEASQQAEEARTLLFTLDATSTPLAWYRAAALSKLGNSSVAQSLFAEALRDNPNHPQVLSSLAASGVSSGVFERSVEFAERALRIAPECDDALRNLAVASLYSGDLKKASESLDRISADYDTSTVRQLRDLIEKAGRTAPSSFP
ncbi:MAG: O-antigen ligase family protein [bacterium]